MSKNQKGFVSTILIIVIVLAVGAVGYFVFVKKPASIVQQTTTQKDKTADWKTYSDSKRGFSLKYPNGWILEESSQTRTTGRVISLRSPKNDQLFKEGKIDPGYSYNLVVSFWPNMNNEYARGGSWIGQRNYTDLADYFTDKNVLKQKVGNTSVAGQNAYEISIRGAMLNYGVMIEHNGIYELSFETASDKSTLGDNQKQILSTFQFTK